MTPEPAELVRHAFTNGVPGSADKAGWQGLQRAVFSVLDALAARDAEAQEQARLLGMSGERELALRAEVARLTRRTEELESGLNDVLPKILRRTWADTTRGRGGIGGQSVTSEREDEYDERLYAEVIRPLQLLLEGRALSGAAPTEGAES